MITRSKAQTQYLRLMSKLYDMASQFDAEELRSVLKIAEEEANRPVVRATQALLMLVKDYNVERSVERRSVAAVASTRAANSLHEIFASREIFPSVQDLISILPFSFEVRQKESRDRLARRLVSHIDALPSEQKQEVLYGLQEFLSTQLGGGFVSNWSKLIRGL